MTRFAPFAVFVVDGNMGPTALAQFKRNTGNKVNPTKIAAMVLIGY